MSDLGFCLPPVAGSLEGPQPAVGGRITNTLENGALRKFQTYIGGCHIGERVHDALLAALDDHHQRLGHTDPTKYTSVTYGSVMALHDPWAKKTPDWDPILDPLLPIPGGKEGRVNKLLLDQLTELNKAIAERERRKASSGLLWTSSGYRRRQ